jgi:phosphoribosylformylglycinamidine synthase
MPIGHGEGCYVADADTLAELEEQRRVVFRYTDEKGAATLDANPNGSTANIAGVMSTEGNVLGLMPHPERCVEALLGGTDGYQIIAKVAGSLAGTRPAIYR